MEPFPSGKNRAILHLRWSWNEEQRQWWLEMERWRWGGCQEGGRQARLCNLILFSVWGRIIALILKSVYWILQGGEIGNGLVREVMRKPRGPRTRLETALILSV